MDKNREPDIIISIDPGSSKSGLAVVDVNKNVISRKIVKSENIEKELSACIERHKPAIILMGDGTCSGKLLPGVKKASGNVPFETVNEKHTTERGKLRYLQEHPRGCLWKLVPLTMQVPGEPVDDYAAIIIAEDYIDLIKL